MIDVRNLWRGLGARAGGPKGRVFAGRTAARPRRPRDEAPSGSEERRVVAEVAVELRISPRFSDDGAPEGTCERPLSIHIDEEPGPIEDDEPEVELDLSLAPIRPFRD